MVGAYIPAPLLNRADGYLSIDKTPRNSDNYMTLFTNEHNLIKKEYDLVTILKLEEEREKEFIRIFSEKIRQSYQVTVEFAI